MKIEILGAGCAKCNMLEKIVRESVNELQLSGEVGKVTDMNEIVNRGLMFTPALYIDGQKKLEGKLPGKEEIKKILKSAAEA